jgi:nucleoside-diphosphate-sugar epimerase
VRMFVAGASGAIGRVLVPKLIAAGHEVTGTTRKQAGAEALRAAGARAAICDALDPTAVDEAVSAARPEVIVTELTSLPKDYDLRTIDYEPTSQLRVEGGRNLVAAGRKAGARRYISQSIAFVYIEDVSGGNTTSGRARSRPVCRRSEDFSVRRSRSGSSSAPASTTRCVSGPGQ